MSIKANDAVLLYTEGNKTFLIRVAEGKVRQVERIISHTGFVTVARKTNNIG